MKDRSRLTEHGAAKGSSRAYTLGFILSLGLTMVAYWLTANHWLKAGWAIAAILVLALSQLFVQLWFFLHLGRESKPRWNLTVLAFAAGVVIILVIGSIWIMYHLSYNMSPDRVNHYVMHEENISR